jgi:phage terminase Nu1 subunit (DNA packaging protein)
MSVDVQAVAKALNLTPRRVQQLKAEGMPSIGRGQYELGPCMAWYIRYLQSKLDKLGPNTNPDTPDLLAEKTRLAREQGDKLAIENSIKRGELVYVSEVVSTWSNHIASCRAKLLGLPTKVAPQLVNQTNANAIAGKLRDEIDAALYELSEGTDDYQHLGSFEDSEQDLEAAAETDDFGMGRSLSETF